MIPIQVKDKSAQALDANACPTDDEVEVTADSGGTVLTLKLYVEAIPEDVNNPAFDPVIPDVGPFTEGTDAVGTVINSVRFCCQNLLYKIFLELKKLQ